MTSWNVLIIVCFILVGISLAADILLYDKEKLIFRDKLLEIWLRLSVREINDIPTKMANFTINSYEKIFGSKFVSLQNVLITAIFSFLLTLAAIVIGRFLEVRTYLTLYDSTRNVVIGLKPFSGSYNSHIIFPLNLFFDYLTIIFTIHIIRLLKVSFTLLRKILLISIDIVVAAMFAISTMTCIKYFTSLSRLAGTKLDLLEAALLRTLDTFNIFIFNLPESKDYDSLFFSLTTFLPTFIYLSIMAFLIIVHVTNKFYTKFTTTFLERLYANSDRAIFSKLATVFSLFLNILNYIFR